MAETKPFASLSSGLLARKGGAKPAMRPQGFGSFGGSLEDLGWNDMGEPQSYDHVPTPIDALTPSPKAPAAQAAPAAPPRIVEQQRALEQSFPPETSDRGAEVVSLPRPASIPARAKAAFTLRLDPDRHLKLRLACALTRSSAQQLVTGALDEFLAALPEVEALADRASAEAPRRSRGAKR
jgi:hypothetical protein